MYRWRKFMDMPDKKNTRRFIIVLFMALIVLAVAVWAFAQSLSYIKNGSTDTTGSIPHTGADLNNSRETVQADMEKLGSDILSKVKFETELKKADESVARGLIKVSDNSELSLYMGDGSYSDVLVLIISPDEEEAQSDQDITEQYLGDMRKSFEAYLPKQAQKAEDAYIERNGCYIAACITSDIDSAKEIIQEAFKTGAGDKAAEVPGEIQDKLDTDTNGTDGTDSINSTGAKAKASVKYKKIYSEADVVPYPSGVITIGDTAYEQYNYIEDIAAQYAEAVNNIALKLKGKSQVYNMVIPTSTGITLPDNKKAEAGSSNQKKALKKIGQKISGDVKFIPLYNGLMEHRTEYIYFRTDHHWTARGAYYAYNLFCQDKQIIPYALEYYKSVSFGSFAGSFYKDTKNTAALKKDEFYVYYPVHNSDITLEYTNKDGVAVKGSIIEDASGYGESTKYSAFIDGDNPYTVIENNALNDGSSCIVIKESFGNALIPYLADNYQKMYVIDYRYWQGSLAGLTDEAPGSDIIIANNISMTRNSYQVGKLASLLEG